MIIIWGSSKIIDLLFANYSRNHSIERTMWLIRLFIKYILQNKFIGSQKRLRSDVY